MFSLEPGGSRAGEAIHFMWRVPPNPENCDNNRAFCLRAWCLTEITTYHTTVKKAMLYAEVVNQSFIHSKAAASVMYKFLTSDHLLREKCKGKADAILMVDMALACQDFDIIQDRPSRIEWTPKEYRICFFFVRSSPSSIYMLVLATAATVRATLINNACQMVYVLTMSITHNVIAWRLRSVALQALHEQVLALVVVGGAVASVAPGVNVPAIAPRGRRRGRDRRHPDEPPATRARKARSRRE
jgi:hypothetical protein